MKRRQAYMTMTNIPSARALNLAQPTSKEIIFPIAVIFNLF